jgi:hypothetical protein
MTRKRHTEEEIIVVLKAHSTIGNVTPQEFITNYQNGAHLYTGMHFFSIGVTNGGRARQTNL